MTSTFDTLGYAKALNSVGVEKKVAEAHAEAVRDYIMKDIVSKGDLEAAKMQIIIAIGSMLALTLGIVLAALPLVLG